jgi:putative transposase
LGLSAERRRALIEPSHLELSVRRQCELLGLNRSTLYYQPAPQTAENLALMRLIDEGYTRHPFKGSRRMAVWLRRQKGQEVNRKRAQRLMRLMGLEAIYPRPNLSAGGGHKAYPYLLRGVKVERPDQVWSTDITYVGLPGGFLYLAAVIDWYSRYVISWRLSNTLEGEFCLDMLQEALGRGKPEVFNADQGAQFTAQAWTGRLESAGVAVSTDGKGRCLDNVFVERLWRTVKTLQAKTACRHARCHGGYNRQHPHLPVGAARTGEVVPRPAGRRRTRTVHRRHPQVAVAPPRP